MDLMTLRSQLATVLDPFLGTYTLANGVTTPALSVRDAGEGLTPGTTVEGLECIILAQPDLTPVLQYRGQGALRDWQVYLVDWDASESLDTVAGIVLYSFSGSRANKIEVPQRVGPRNQMLLSIPGDAEILNYTPPSAIGQELPSGFSFLNPQASTSFTLFRVSEDTTLASVQAVMRGTGSVTFIIKYASSRAAAGTGATISTTVSSTTTGTTVALDQMPIPADSFVWIEITGITGTPTELSVTLET